MVRFNRNAAAELLQEFINKVSPADTIGQYGSDVAVKNALRQMFSGVKIRGVQSGDDVLTIVNKGVSEAQKVPNQRRLPFSYLSDGGYTHVTRVLPNGELKIMTNDNTGLFTLIQNQRCLIEGVPGNVDTMNSLASTVDLNTQVMRQTASRDGVSTAGRSITKRLLSPTELEVGTYPNFDLNPETEITKLKKHRNSRSFPNWSGDVIDLSNSKVSMPE